MFIKCFLSLGIFSIVFLRICRKYFLGIGIFTIIFLRIYCNNSDGTGNRRIKLEDVKLLLVINILIWTIFQV